MICEDVAEYSAVVTALRDWHRNNTPPPAATGITVTPGGEWTIPYGCYGQQNGSIQMKRTNFEVTHVTSGGNMVAFTYNHVWGAHGTAAAFIAALSAADLSQNEAARALIICMASEAARSDLVFSFVKGSLSYETVDSGDFGTVKMLTAQYEHTQRQSGGTIAPGPAWRPLNTVHHQGYEVHLRDVKKVKDEADGVANLIGKFGAY